EARAEALCAVPDRQIAHCPTLSTPYPPAYMNSRFFVLQHSFGRATVDSITEMIKMSGRTSMNIRKRTLLGLGASLVVATAMTPVLAQDDGTVTIYTAHKSSIVDTLL